MEERLHKVLALAGIASRRKAEELIRQGRVQVDGQVVSAMGVKVDPERQHITCDGQPLQRQPESIYLLLNKPAGYVTTMRDPQGRPTVASLVADVGVRLFPVGRLDLDTEGALLMTNDGDIAQAVQHPSYQVEKTYHAEVWGTLSPNDIQRLEEGIMLEGQRTWPARIRCLRSDREGSSYEVIIHEGRKRQIRKMFAAIGHRVRHLRRVAYGSLRLGNLAPGSYRQLTPAEVTAIFS
ncbi:MAG: pseudouridine synthase [Desulfobulbaceae bacterium A2]|nr:MAG: pseudouridine synthase [Desulfobulbaceae bacterium A2]